MLNSWACSSEVTHVVWKSLMLGQTRGCYTNTSIIGAVFWTHIYLPQAQTYTSVILVSILNTLTTLKYRNNPSTNIQSKVTRKKQCSSRDTNIHTPCGRETFLVGLNCRMLHHSGTGSTGLINLMFHRELTLNHSFIHSFTHSFTLSFIHPLPPSLPPSFIHSFIHLLIHSFIHLFNHSFIHSFIHVHSFIHSLTHYSLSLSLTLAHTLTHPAISRSYAPRFNLSRKYFENCFLLHCRQRQFLPRIQSELLPWKPQD